ncbi:MAG: ArsI/CadI family heavy metal resistance metalloenzyme [Pseudomonadota bacterium]
MKRLHVHISVDDLTKTKRFYSALFGQAPSVDKDDYAKWEVDDPRVNLAVSQRGARPAGLNHLGIQAETDAELVDLHDRLASADQAMLDENGAHCCYAHGDKHWTTDPSDVVWEMFHTMEQAQTFGEDFAPEAVAKPAARPLNSRGCC